MKTDGDRKLKFALPDFDLGRAFKPEVIPIIGDVMKMCRKLDYILVF